MEFWFQLPEEVWLWIADINGKYLNKTLKENNEPWRLDMHIFIDHLADGKTIEEALLAIK